MGRLSGAGVAKARARDEADPAEMARILIHVNWPFAFVLSLLVVGLFGSMYLRHWLFSRYQAGQVGGRRAGWIYAVAAGVPFLALMVYLVIRSPGNMWLALLSVFLILGVQIVPWIAAFRYPEDERRKRQP
jgi:hypothetical protein